MFHMDTNRIRYFCTIAEVGSLIKAAEILNISHSGLSKAITSLEEETKLKLFRPQGRGLEITEEGKWFYQKSLEILKIIDEVSVGIKKESSVVRIGLSEVLATTCASLIARELDQSISIIETDVGEAEKKILSSELDFAYVFSPSPVAGIEYLQLGEVTFNSYARKNFIHGKSSQTLYYTTPATQFPYNPVGYKIRDGWPHDVPRALRFSVSSFSIALDLLRSGESAIYMPNFVANLENENTYNQNKIVKIPEHKIAESKRKLLLVKASKQDESKEMKIVSKVLRKYCCA
jgi:DNA-binding transcriptional LysR family regulator